MKQENAFWLLHSAVNFPFPNATRWEAIWRRIFPARTWEQGLSYNKVLQLEVAAGNIRNVALNAAFLAAEARNGKPVETKRLVRAARSKAEKIERPLIEAETKGWG